MEAVKSIVVIGIGGVGGYFGGKIAYNIKKNNNKEYQIYFIARGSHLNAVKEKGLILKTADQRTLICNPQNIFENVNEISQIDIIILAVKSYDLESAIGLIKPKVAKNTIILPLLNGIDIYERIRKTIKSGIVLPSCVYISSHIEKPGIVIHRIGKELIIIGPDPKRKEFYPAVLLDAFKLFDINYKWTTEVDTAIWEKYLFIASYAMVTALYNKSMGEVYNDPTLKNTTMQIMFEIYNIGKVKGIGFNEFSIEKAINKASDLPSETKTSFQLDIAHKGARNESNIYAETIIRMSQETGIAIPVTIKIHQELLKQIDRTYTIK
jgi:2-dehydropantoate 2-reductase